MTTFEEVYVPFLNKLVDLSFIEMPEEVAKTDLLGLLKAAIFNFEYPKIDLTITELTESFVEDLGADEIQLLAYLMTFEWFKRNVMDINWFTSDKTPSEFKTFSKSNRITAMEKTGVFFRDEMNRLKKTYHMKNGARSGYSKLS